MISVMVIEVVTRKTVSVEISEDSTVRQLKCLIEGKGLGPVHCQRLAHAGKLLVDDMNLQQCGVVSIPSVVLSIRPAPVDSTVGAMARGSRPSENDVPSHSTRMQPIMQREMQENSTAAVGEQVEDADEDENIPTCRICHGAPFA